MVHASAITLSEKKRNQATDVPPAFQGGTPNSFEQDGALAGTPHGDSLHGVSAAVRRAKQVSTDVTFCECAPGCLLRALSTCGSSMDRNIEW